MSIQIKTAWLPGWLADSVGGTGANSWFSFGVIKIGKSRIASTLTFFTLHWLLDVLDLYLIEGF